MWNSYFFQIQSKYSMRVSFKNPLVIRLDGKDVTKNKKYDLLNNYEGNFRNTLEKTAEFFTKKYNMEKICFRITNIYAYYIFYVIYYDRCYYFIGKK